MLFERKVESLFGSLLLSLCFMVAAAAQAADRFPKTINGPEGTLVLKMPVVADWQGFRTLSGEFPLELTGGGVAGSVTGRASFTADTVVDFEDREVELRNTRISGVRFHQYTPADKVNAWVRETAGAKAWKLDLDIVLHSLPADFQVPQEAAPRAQLNFSPPRIVVSEEPMRLMMIDGPPSKVPIAATGLEFVVNTDWDVFHNRENNAWYILDNGAWLYNNMLSSGDWISTTEIPRDFLTLQVSSEWPQVADAMPARQPESPPLPITISYEPTALVLIDGEPRFEQIADTGLQFVSNTRNDLFLLDDRYYLLLSGRWFSTKNMKKMWYPVRNLPENFARIPRGHKKDRALASVAGTQAARLAMIEAAIPRIAMVSMDAGDGLAVPYVGEPSFVEIQGTGLRRAENTPYQVIMNNNFYYLCHEGAWYSSSNPRDNWDVAREIPEAIYTIPPTDPAYNVTYVRLGAFDDSSGRMAYKSTSGYYSRYYTGSTMVYGTGWYYPGYYNRSVYWRYPYTYGHYGAWGPYWPHSYNYSATFNANVPEKDWQWDLDGNKRQVYRYGPRNQIGGTYVMPESNVYKGDGK